MVVIVVIIIISEPIMVLVEFEVSIALSTVQE